MSGFAGGRSRAHVARTRGAVASALLVGAVLAWSSPAAAQSKDELNRARQEFQEGVALAAANNCAAAIGKFRSVLQVKATAQVSFNIAECEERMGRLAAAVGDYRVARQDRRGRPEGQGRLRQKCGDKIAAIEQQRIPKETCTINRGNGAELSATIELDGVELGAAQLGTEIPVDPGPHVIVGKVGEKVYFRQNVTLEEKEAKPIDVVMKVSNTPIAVDETKPDKTEGGAAREAALAHAGHRHRRGGRGQRRRRRRLLRDEPGKARSAPSTRSAAKARPRARRPRPRRTRPAAARPTWASPRSPSASAPSRW